MSAAALFAAAIACLCVALAPPAQGLASSQRVNLGPEDQAAPITVTVWLKLHNEAALNALVQQMYDKNSPNYHHWLTPEQAKSQFAPTAQDVGAVIAFLASQNLAVSSVDAKHHFVVAQGRVADAQRAFNTQINRVMVNGQVQRVTSAKPTVSGATAALVDAVQGLSTHVYRNYVSRVKDPETGQFYHGVSPFSAGPDGIFFSGDCLRSPETKTFNTNGGYPKATYTGNRYGADVTNNNPPHLPPCGYDAQEMQTAYGVKSLIQSGLDGTGQTIVIVDAYGSNTIRPDVNLFSQLNHLPLLTPANFKVVRPTGPVSCTPTNGCISGGWNIETTLDVEWAHAIAPNANIVLVLAKNAEDATIDAANQYAIQNHLGNVISNSFGIPEIALIEFDPNELIVTNRIARMAAASGISQNASSGDQGDFLAFDTFVLGVPVTSVSLPAASPFVTAIGGTSTFLNDQNQILLQTGWGTNEVVVAGPRPDNPPLIPLLYFGFIFGSGGGTSAYYPQPSYQSQLGGNFRKLPDISMVADPFTPVEIIVTPDSVPGNPQFVFTVGGTSVSCPMFSALWAIANQSAAANGQGPLGQAAPLLYNLPGGAITDVNVTNNFYTQHNVTGTIINPPNPPERLSALVLAAPQEPTNQFVSALYHSPFSTTWRVLAFGTDSSLATRPGWDDVTGLGSPNGAAFVNAVVAAAQQ